MAFIKKIYLVLIICLLVFPISCFAKIFLNYGMAKLSITDYIQYRPTNLVLIYSPRLILFSLSQLYIYHFMPSQLHNYIEARLENRLFSYAWENIGKGAEDIFYQEQKQSIQKTFKWLQGMNG